MKLNKWMSLALVAAVMLLVGDNAYAADAADNSKGLVGLGAGLAIGLAALGGAIGQGNAASHAYDAIARNPQASGKLNTPFFVGLALIESLVIYALVIAFFLQGKITF